MITRHVIRPNAAEDFDQQLDYYQTEAGLELTLRFFGAVEEAIDFLYRYPDAGSPKEFSNPRLKGLRSWPVPGFENIQVYYLGLTRIRFASSAFSMANETWPTFLKRSRGNSQMSPAGYAGSPRPD